MAKLEKDSEQKPIENIDNKKPDLSRVFVGNSVQPKVGEKTVFVLTKNGKFIANCRKRDTVFELLRLAAKNPKADVLYGKDGFEIVGLAGLRGKVVEFVD